MAAVLARNYPGLYAALGVHSGVPAGLAYDVFSALRLMSRGPADGQAGADLSSGNGVGHAVLKLVHLVFDLLQPSKRCQRGLVHGRAGFEVNVLGQQSKFQASRAHNFTPIRRLFLGHQPKDRRLSGPVSSDQTDMLAGIDLERGAAQDILRSIGFENVGKTEEHS